MVVCPGCFVGSHNISFMFANGGLKTAGNWCNEETKSGCLADRFNEKTG
jgi:hypothetical protein